MLIGGRLSRRLRKAATAAGKVAQGNTDVRVREAIGGVVRDETDELARAVDALTDALNERIEAERRVTADIAHELRTPVTGLLTAAELLPPGRPTELVRDRARAMRTLVEDVLEVARLDSASERAELQEIALGEFVARRVALLNPDAEVRVVHESWVNTDPPPPGADPRQPPDERREVRQAADRGHRRGAGAAGARPRAGFPEALLREGPSRFRTGASDRAGAGHGLGLTIAAGQARVLGARLTFRNAAAPDGTAAAAAPGAPEGRGGSALPGGPGAPCLRKPPGCRTPPAARVPSGAQVPSGAGMSPGVRVRPEGPSPCCGCRSTPPPAPAASR